ncbi:MAG: ATP:cob(I)alamin adenosyltransferase [Actinobacteria bacterium 69-20]|nr:cob(I)yrinic acid a,c-diamide adenosyltransferase [Actinomycetota bacterium]OJV26886.1 MAG: ATP:cob(I)alamin adenosyltransferase [Actinobacteria bacterium 69-20]
MTDRSRIYTKLGDDGSTGLLFGGRTSKGSLVIDVVGSIDETVTALGAARAVCTDSATASIILTLQRDLFVAAADIAANPRARDKLTPRISLVTAEMVADLESTIDRLMSAKPLRPVFIVPGANQASALLDEARSTARRAERRLSAMTADQHPAINPQVRAYLNRVSDLVFVLARHAAGDDEEPASHDVVGP